MSESESIMITKKIKVWRSDLEYVVLRAKYMMHESSAFGYRKIELRE